MGEDGYFYPWLAQDNDEGPTSQTYTPEHFNPDAPVKVVYEDPREKPARAVLRTDPNLRPRTPTEMSEAEEGDPEEETKLTPLEKKINAKVVDEISLSKKEQKQLKKILLRWSRVFASSSYDLGECNLGTHAIDTGNATPIYCNPRKVPYQARAALKAELDELKTINIIRDSNSPWAAPIVLVNKKDGTKRLCIDYRLLNEVAARSSFPLPKIIEIFAVLQGMRYFTSLDLAKGFWQIKIAPEDCHKTAFTTPFGQFEFVRLPFGLNSSPGAFQGLMQGTGQPLVGERSGIRGRRADFHQDNRGAHASARRGVSTT
jgi:hypothetical protein